MQCDALRVLPLLVTIAGCPSRFDVDKAAAATTGAETSATPTESTSGVPGSSTGSESNGDPTTGLTGVAEDGLSATDTGAEDPCVDVSCDAQLADAPSSLFNEDVLVRPPLSEATFVEMTPSVARLEPVPALFDACEGCIAEIEFGAIGYRVYDDAQPIWVLATEIVEGELAYPNSAMLTEDVVEESRYIATVRVPGEDGQTLLHITIAPYGIEELAVWVAYRCPSAHWQNLRETFVSSGESVLVIPP